MAKAYTYDSATKKLLTSIDVATGKAGEYILPPNSTMVAPPPTVTAGKELYWQETPAGEGTAASSQWSERDIVVEEEPADEDPTVVIDGMTKIPEFRLRAKVQELLERTDWTQLADYPGTAEQQAAWASYRAAVRALPSTDGWPDSPNWPTPPEQLAGVRFEQAEREYLSGTFTNWDSISRDASILPNSWERN